MWRLKQRCDRPLRIQRPPIRHFACERHHLVDSIAGASGKLVGPARDLELKNELLRPGLVERALNMKPSGAVGELICQFERILQQLDQDATQLGRVRCVAHWSPAGRATRLAAERRRCQILFLMNQQGESPGRSEDARHTKRAEEVRNVLNHPIDGARGSISACPLGTSATK